MSFFEGTYNVAADLAQSSPSELPTDTKKSPIRKAALMSQSKSRSSSPSSRQSKSLTPKHNVAGIVEVHPVMRPSSIDSARQISQVDDQASDDLINSRPKRKIVASRRKRQEASYHEVSDHKEQDSTDELTVVTPEKKSKTPVRKRPATNKRPRRPPAKRKKIAATENASDDEHGSTPAVSKPVKTIKRTGGAQRQRYTKKWDPQLVVTDSKSPLATAKLIEILKSDKAWDLLSPEQQRELITYLPRAPSDAMRDIEEEMAASVLADQPLPNIALQRLNTSMAFKSDIRQFQEDLDAGKLDISWVEQALMASERRKRGDFDDWKVKERENYWEMNHDETSQPQSETQ